MNGRPHRDRLLHELNEIRAGLAEEVQRFQPEEIDWVPRLGMKSCRTILLEIGTMEKVCVHMISHQEELDWKETEAAIAWTGTEPAAALKSLDQVRAGTLAYLQHCSEEKLQTPIPVPQSWYQYFDSATIEPEEMLRWVARHEYYHLGQLIIYRWQLGDDPHNRA
jgi:uncharacterized damage-inducible protein DinB